MKTTDSKNKYLSDRDKQIATLQGEVSLEEARKKAFLFAAHIKNRMKNMGAKFK